MNPMNKRILFIFVLVSMILLNSMPIYADTFESWIRNKDSGYTHAPGGTVKPLPSGAVVHGVAGGVPSAKDDTNDSFETRFSTWLVKLGAGISEEMKDGAIDGSATGIVMAHLTTGNSFFVFDLTDTNIYGIIGATIYAALRTLVLAFLFIFVLCRLIMTLYEGDIHGLASLKEVLYSALLTMILMFIMPQIVDWVCTARDAVATSLYTKILAISGGEGDAQAKMLNVQGLELVYYNMWAANRSTGNAIIYLMVTVIVPLVYVVSYFKIAIQQTMLFGMYPAFALLGLGDSSLNGKWAVHFFSNAFVPTLDMVLMFIPALVSMAMAEAGMEDGFLKALIIMACFVSIVPVRNQIIAMLGNSFGVRPSIGGALALGAAAIGGIKALSGSVAAATQGGRSNSSDSAAAKSETEPTMEEKRKDLQDVPQADENAKKTKDPREFGKLDDIPSKEDDGTRENYEGLMASNGIDDDSNGDPLPREVSGAIDEADHFNISAEDKKEIDDFFDNNRDQRQDILLSPDEKSLERSETENSLFHTETPDQAPALYEAASSDVTDKVPESNPMDDKVVPEIATDIPSKAETIKAATVQPGDIKARASAYATGERTKPAEESRAARVLSSSKPEKLDENTKRLANLETMANLRHEDNILRDSISSYRAEIVTSSNVIQQNDKKIAALSGSSDPAVQRQIETLQASTEEHNNIISKANARMRQAQDVREAIQAQLSNTATVEDNYAGNNKPYSSPEGFAKAVETDKRKEEIRNLKDFSGVQSSGFLSDSDRIKYERQLDLGRAGRYAIGAAGGLAATGAAMIALSVAGEEAMEQGSRQIGQYYERKFKEISSKK